MKGTDGQRSAEERRDAQQAEARRLLDGTRQYETGPWATFISLLALVLSATSIYQTTLKQPMPTLYMSGTFRFGHDGSRKEIFAIPMTIVNHGPRDTVITSISLAVMRAGVVNPPPVFVSSYFGDAPKRSDSLFTPISVAGHSSFAGSIVFARNSDGDDAAIAGKDTYQFCLSIRTETGDDIGFLGSLLTFRPSALSFQANMPYFDISQLAAGQDLALPVQNITRVTGGDNPSDLPACR